MFNRQLESNPEQHAAIQRIVAGSSKPAPYIVFGPPGTGKTITLVEAMNQVNQVFPHLKNNLFLVVRQGVISQHIYAWIKRMRGSQKIKAKGMAQ